MSTILFIRQTYKKKCNVTFRLFVFFFFFFIGYSANTTFVVLHNNNHYDFKQLSECRISILFHEGKFNKYCNKVIAHNKNT